MNTETNSHTTPPGFWFGVIEHELRRRMRAELSEFDLRRGSWRILSTIADGATTTDDIAQALPPRRGGAGRNGHDRRRHGWRGRRFGRGFGPGFGPGFDGAAAGHPCHHVHEGDDGHDHHHTPDHDGHGAGRDHHSHHEPSQHRHPEHGAHHPRTHRIDATIADFAERGWVTRSGERNERVELTDTGRDAYESALGRIQGLRQSMTAGIADADYATTIATLEAMARNLGWRERTAPAPGPDPS